MPKTKTTKSRQVRKISDNDIVVQWLTLSEDQKKVTTLDALIKSNNIRSVKRKENIASLVQAIQPTELQHSELESLEHTIHLRNNLLNMLQFPMDAEVQITLNDLKSKLAKVLEFVDSMNQIGVGVETEEEWKEMAKLIINLTRQMHLARSAKDIRQVLNDVDIAKERVEFIKQVHE